MFTLFFVSPQELTNAEITLGGPQAHHALSVLRVKEREYLRLADGLGNWAQGPIVSLAKSSLTVKIESRGSDGESKASITIAQALLKGDNQKAALDQLVQADADRIIPWQAQRSIGSANKNEKWQEVILTSARQSRRARIPRLDVLSDLDQLIKIRSQFDVTIALHESASVKLSEVAEVTSARRILAIVGPEGGLSDTEIEQITDAQVPLVKLGNPVIRADLAGAIAVSAFRVITREW